jgi:hypothetical protein
MWAIISNNVIEQGPRDWNRWVFQGWISDNLNLTMNLPQQPTSNDPIAINDYTSIVPVIMTPQPDFNSRTQQLAGPELTINLDNVTGVYTVADQPISQVQGAMLNQLAANRYTQEIAGCHVTLQEQRLWVSTDRVTRQIWLNALQLGVTNQTWKFNNTTWLTLTTVEMQSVADAMTVHVQAAFDWEKTIHDQIASAVDLTTLANININWPNPQDPFAGVS